jgi:hypothetical protein
MDRYTASCAVCGGPADPDCSCESHRLNMSIDQAERRWLDKWREDTRYAWSNSYIEFSNSFFSPMRLPMSAYNTINLPLINKSSENGSPITQ